MKKTINKIYAGIGSRKTPSGILLEMTRISSYLDKKGFKLRSGGAQGADKAFEDGSSKGNKEIYYKEDADSKSDTIASQLHENWNGLSTIAKKYISRNIKQILGNTLDKPVDFIICWTPNGKSVGGTRIGIYCGKKYNIPVFNLAIKKDRIKLNSFLKSL